MKGLYIVLPVLVVFFCSFSKVLLFLCLQAKPIGLAGCMAVLSEVMHKKFMFNEDLNNLVRLGMDGREASE